jgi:hypothetical protein
MPIPFIRLCRPNASGFPSPALIARQFSQPNQAHREIPPAVPLKQTMHKSQALETSQPSHRSGESSSGHDCHRPRRCTGPRNLPQGICTDNSVMRSRSAASVALNCFSVISAVSGDATLGRPPLARIHVPALPLGHRAVGARLPERRARYPNSRSLLSFRKLSGLHRQSVGSFFLRRLLHCSACEK